MPDGENGERRNSLLGALGGWWHAASLLQKVTSLAIMLLSIGFASGGAWYAVQAQYGPLPQQVENLRSHASTDSTVYWQDTREAMARLDSLELRQEDAAEAREELNQMLRQLRQLAQANNCWIRVAADAESRFNCSEAP